MGLADFAGPGQDNTPDAVAIGAGLTTWGFVQALIGDGGPLLPLAVAILSAVVSRAGVEVARYVMDRLAAERDATPRHLPACSMSCAPGCPVQEARRAEEAPRG